MQAHQPENARTASYGSVVSSTRNSAVEASARGSGGGSGTNAGIPVGTTGQPRRTSPVGSGGSSIHAGFGDPRYDSSGTTLDPIVHSR